MYMYKYIIAIKLGFCSVSSLELICIVFFFFFLRETEAFYAACSSIFRPSFDYSKSLSLLYLLAVP